MGSIVALSTIHTHGQESPQGEGNIISLLPMRWKEFHSLAIKVSLRASNAFFGGVEMLWVSH